MRYHLLYSNASIELTYAKSSSFCALNQIRKLRTIQEFTERFPGVSELIIDGTERPIQRPENRVRQKQNYSGKKRQHTRKHLAGVALDKQVLVLTHSREGKLHDKREKPLRGFPALRLLSKKRFHDEEDLIGGLPDEITVLLDSGFQGVQKDYDNIKLPHKKPKGKKLTESQKLENRALSSRRVICELVDAFTANQVFLDHRYTNSQPDLTQQIERGQVDAGLIIPATFSRDLLQTGTSEVAMAIDGINAYSSGLAKGYIAQIATQFNLNLLEPLSTGLEIPLQSQITFRYNPGTLDSWFFVPGVIGTIITLSAILAAAVEAVREKDQGTLEQLLMTPVASTAILISKIVLISGLLTGTLLLCFMVARCVFQLPFRGNLLLLLIFSILYIQIGVAIGLAISTFSNNKLQTILVGIFLTIPIILLGGAVTAVNSMPWLFRWIAQINPLYHYLVILRGILLKGAGLEVLWLHAIAMILFAIATLLVSANRYRRQLS